MDLISVDAVSMHDCLFLQPLQHDITLLISLAMFTHSLSDISIRTEQSNSDQFKLNSYPIGNPFNNILKVHYVGF